MLEALAAKLREHNEHVDASWKSGGVAKEKKVGSEGGPKKKWENGRQASHVKMEMLKVRMK